MSAGVVLLRVDADGLGVQCAGCQLAWGAAVLHCVADGVQIRATEGGGGHDNMGYSLENVECTLYDGSVVTAVAFTTHVSSTMCQVHCPPLCRGPLQMPLGVPSPSLADARNETGRPIVFPDAVAMVHGPHKGFRGRRRGGRVGGRRAERLLRTPLAAISAHHAARRAACEAGPQLRAVAPAAAAVLVRMLRRRRPPPPPQRSCTCSLLLFEGWRAGGGHPALCTVLGTSCR